ncbi:MAG: RNA methyltransferase, TrmH family, group 3 [Benjaminiella poitrasii]|nr:MAG: RNA methyltransferase, TrmH family, group 3 [Benjaminiella poitrasii]
MSMRFTQRTKISSTSRLFSTSAILHKKYKPVIKERAKISSESTWDHVYGLSSVLSALHAKKRSILDSIFIQDSKENHTTSKKKDNSLIEEVLKLAKAANLKIVSVDKGQLNNMTDNKPHQGVVLRASPRKSIEISALSTVDGTVYKALPKINKRGSEESRLKNQNVPAIQFDKPSGRMPFWIALDEVQDPQNLGSILRTAYFFGVDGVLLCSKNSAPLSSTVSKVSSGAVEIMDIYSASNLVKFLKDSQNNGWEVIGAAGDVHPSLNLQQFRQICKQPVIVVFGNEGVGLRTNVRNSCSSFVSISSANMMEQFKGSVDSLNVGVAAGVLISSALSN